MERIAVIKSLDEMTLHEIGRELEQRLLATWKEKYPHGNQLRIEAVKNRVVVHYGPSGHRMKMTRAEVLRFLDITAVMPGEAEEMSNA